MKLAAITTAILNSGVVATYAATCKFRASLVVAAGQHTQYETREGEYLFVTGHGPIAGVVRVEPEDGPEYPYWIEEERLKRYAEFRGVGKVRF